MVQTIAEFFFFFFLKLFSYKDAPILEIVYGTSVSNHSIDDLKFVILLKLVLTPRNCC